ncbi:MAG: tetratricopeptide repeat protein [Ruminococcus sp.]|nr:tetratricopeptide repeat protein [Ruminococcus sp.]
MNKKLVIILVPVMAVIIALIGVLGFLLVSDGGSVYTEQIKIADKYLEAGDYETAILYYRNAIAQDNTQEEPYIRLAQIYLYQGRMTDLVAVLQNGYTNTGSDDIYNMLMVYQEYDENATNKDDAKVEQIDNLIVINTSLVDVFSAYTYETYTDKFTFKSEIKSPGVYTVCYSQYDIDFEYRNTAENPNVVNEDTGLPYPYARPTSIKVNDISALIPSVEQGVTAEDIRSYGITSVRVNPSNATVGSDYITFVHNNCEFLIACDSDGKIIATECYNIIVPPKNDVSIDKVNLSGKVIDVTTGNKVLNTTLVFREGENVRNGNFVVNCTAYSGDYTVEIAPGDYTVEVSSDNFNKEYFNITVPQTADFVQDFSISPVLSGNQIRIVLEWGSTPVDLDSHLVGTASDGSSVNVNFMHKIETSGSKEIANLDVDDMSGFGPETITINDINGNYTYRVNKFSSDGTLAASGATVKIYTSDSQPIVVTIPTDIEGRWWDVCTIENGNISNINGSY